MHQLFFAVVFAIAFSSELVAEAQQVAEAPPELRIGRAGHAFDHLGNIGEQAIAAAASGSTIIYATGLGGCGYAGLPPQDELELLSSKASDYNRRAKANGIELSIGYLCATSIVKLDSFDKNWTDEFRAEFKTKPAEWRQQDRSGKSLASWYGGDYQPACMSNPDWRAYERAMVRRQLETGHDGVFFDNPTVHPQGCYCPHCMKAFAKYFTGHAAKPFGPETTDDIGAIRALAISHPEEFLRFRTTIARDFLADMRAYARKINPRALVTCNNSLNAPSAFYSQCRNYGYSIEEMSKAEDFVVVEDMATQPRTEANGQMIEYGSMYKQLHAISHGKPIVAVTLANGDYHTPPNLVRLAMAEAAAHNASYLSWPTWPEAQRPRMTEAIRPQADFLRANQDLLNDAMLRADVAIFLPFQRWRKTDQCGTTALATALIKENIQYTVVSEGGLGSLAREKQRPLLLVESRAVLTPDEEAAVAVFDKEGPGIVMADQPDWLQQLRLKNAQRTSITVKGAPAVRAVVHDQPGRTIVHLYNLKVQRVSSFEDKVTPANNMELVVHVPFERVGNVSIRTADAMATSGPLKFNTKKDDARTIVAVNVLRVDIYAILIIEKRSN